MNKQARSSRNPWTFLPTLYFAEGLPYVLINTVSVILYKRMGIDNAHIAFWTSWLYLPWVIKMFWGPLVDVYSTKRNWILSTQARHGASACSSSPSRSDTERFFFLSLAAFCAGAFISATYDIATDGFYMLALTEKEQALFVGIRSAFYRLAMIFGSGFLVYLAGTLETATGNIPRSWSMVMAVAGLDLCCWPSSITGSCCRIPHADAPVRSEKDARNGFFRRSHSLPISGRRGSAWSWPSSCSTGWARPCCSSWFLPSCWIRQLQEGWGLPRRRSAWSTGPWDPLPGDRRDTGRVAHFAVRVQALQSGPW